MIVEAEGNSYKLFLLQALLFYYRQFQILIIIIISSILLHGSMVDSYHTNVAQNSQQIISTIKEDDSIAPVEKIKQHHVLCVITNYGLYKQNSGNRTGVEWYLVRA